MVDFKASPCSENVFVCLSSLSSITLHVPDIHILYIYVYVCVFSEPSDSHRYSPDESGKFNSAAQGN